MMHSSSFLLLTTSQQLHHHRHPLLLIPLVYPTLHLFLAVPYQPSGSCPRTTLILMISHEIPTTKPEDVNEEDAGLIRPIINNNRETSKKPMMQPITTPIEATMQCGHIPLLL
jgi:hypothetical protein